MTFSLTPLGAQDGPRGVTFDGFESISVYLGTLIRLTLHAVFRMGVINSIDESLRHGGGYAAGNWTKKHNALPPKPRRGFACKQGGLILCGVVGFIPGVYPPNGRCALIQRMGGYSKNLTNIFVYVFF